MVPRNDNIAELWQKISMTLRSFHPRPSIDLDSLTQDIIIEAWQFSIPVTLQFIKHRFINSFHSDSAYRGAIERSISSQLIAPDEAAASDSISKLNRIMLAADLTPFEMQLIILIYHMNLTHDQVQRRMNWSESRFKSTLSSAMSKLKTAGRQIEANDEIGGGI